MNTTVCGTKFWDTGRSSPDFAVASIVRNHFRSDKNVDRFVTDPSDKHAFINPDEQLLNDSAASIRAQ